MEPANKSFGQSLRAAVKQNQVLRAVLWPALAVRHAVVRKNEEALERHYQQLFALVEGGSLIVRLPDCQGSFEVGARSTLLRRILKFGCYEPEIVKVFLQHLPRDRDAMDIGANVGFFTVLMAKNLAPGRRVLAVEPAPQALQYLKGNLARNHVEKSVIVCEGAAMSEKGNINLHVVAGKEEYSSFLDARVASAQGGGTSDSQAQLSKWIDHSGIANAETSVVNTAADTVDNMVERTGLDPGFIKMDAEGAEYLILQGAVKTLRRCKPIVVSEIMDIFLRRSGASSEMVFRLLEEQGYKILDADNPDKPATNPFAGTIIAFPQPS